MINAEIIDAIATQLEAIGLSVEGMAALRAAYPALHFTHCMDDDMGAQEPYSNRPGYNIYLVDGRGHCMAFTREISHATGLVLAEVSTDD